MYYSNKCQLVCTYEQSVGGKRAVWYASPALLKPVNSDGYDEMRDETEIYVRIMDSVYY